MISSFDDYCLHQAPGYLRVPGTTDRNFYDRYFFCGYDPTSELFFGVTFGRYPNRFVQDGHFSVVLGDSQHSLHASDVLAADPVSCRVGPLQIEVIEPMRMLRCVADDNSTGIHCELLFRAETGAIDEGRLRVDRDGIEYIDQTRFMQYGSWEGWLSVDGERRIVAPGTTWGLRDKSWGVRLIGDQHATQKRGDQIFWMNLVLRLDSGFCVFRTLNRPDGSAQEREGYQAPLYGSVAKVPVGETQLKHVADWQCELDFAAGTRRICGGRYRVQWQAGGETLIEASAGQTLQYAGMGYNHERWHHGLDHDGLCVERESWRLDEIDPTALDRQFLASVMTFSSNGRHIGFGHTEQLLMGEYAPFGWAHDAYDQLD